MEIGRIGKCQSQNSFVAEAEQVLYVLSVFLNTDSDEADVTSLGGLLFHTFAPATGKARPQEAKFYAPPRPTKSWRRHWDADSTHWSR